MTPSPDRRTIVFLPSAVRDLGWFQEYCAAVFPAGAVPAVARFDAALTLLAEHPQAGRRSGAYAGQRVYHVPQTPFAIVYRLTDNRVELISVPDQRARHGAG